MDKSIGALWKKDGSKGPFFSGNIEINGMKLEIIAFVERDKKNPKGPDIKIYISKPREQKPADTGLPF